MAGLTLNTCYSGMNAIGKCLLADFASRGEYIRSMQPACNAAWMSIATPSRWAAFQASELQ